MEWCVVKTGFQMFDALYASGLATVISQAGETMVTLQDGGATYRITASIELTHLRNLTLNDILPLPSATELQELSELPQKTSLQLTVLDGLLAVLFTIPGIRAVSVSDLIRVQGKKSSATDKALEKVETTKLRWEQYLNRVSGNADCWLLDCLLDYDPKSPRIPQPGQQQRKRRPDLTAVMTLDPALGFSLSQPISDGVLTKKTNVAIYDTRYATLLAYIGASRFLRAQQVAGSTVNFYVPIFRRAVFTPEMTMPILNKSPLAADWAMLNTLLAQLNYNNFDWEFDSLAYQTLQTQGQSQSISVAHGFIDSGWLTKLAETVGWSLLHHWQHLTGLRPTQWPCELAALVDVLAVRSQTAWLGHLRDTADVIHSDKTYMRPYMPQEIQEVTNLMKNGANETPLTAMLKHQNGTVRFGHALRLLEAVNKGAARDILDRLDSVRTTDQLLRTLATTAQECMVASGRTKFILVPNDDDFEPLLQEIQAYGAQTVASLLIILSSLRYPPLPDNNDNTLSNEKNSEIDRPTALEENNDEKQ